MSLELLTEHHLEFLSLKGGCTGWSECTVVKMPHCWKSHATAHFSLKIDFVLAANSANPDEMPSLIFKVFRTKWLTFL